MFLGAAVGTGKRSEVAPEVPGDTTDRAPVQVATAVHRVWDREGEASVEVEEVEVSEGEAGVGGAD